MKTFQSLALAAGLASVASAHMEMLFPPPFKSKANPNAGQDIDFSMTAPLSQDGSNFPCKGYHSLIGTDAGKPTADFAPGQSYEFKIAGGAAHNGGSCQASLSYDKGATWTVIHSYIGNCPVQGESSFPFVVPSDAPGGEAIFAWTWFNKVGNREMYMNCAAVNIGGGAAKRQASAAFSSRPSMFVANVGNGCTVTETTDVEFPNPGPDVTVDPAAAKGAPEGNCGTGAGAPPAQDPPTQDPPVASSSAAQPPVVVSSSAAVQPPVASPTTAPGGVFVTVPPAAGTTKVAPPVVESSTLVTLTKSTEAPVPTPIQPSATPVKPSAPVGSPTTPKPTPGAGTPPTGGAGSVAPGTACTSEGLWNCVDGSQFQRCASGQWSVLQPMAAGLTCVPGQGETLNFKKRSARGFWWV